MSFRSPRSIGPVLELKFFPEKGNAFPKKRNPFRPGPTCCFGRARSATARTCTAFQNQNSIISAQVFWPFCGTEIAGLNRSIKLPSSLRIPKGSAGEPSPRTVLVITICAHCKKVISETTRQDNRISHGICSKCLARLEKELPANSNPRVHPHPSRSHLKKAKEGSR